MFFPQPLATWDTVTSEQPRSGSFKLDRTAAISWWRLLLGSLPVGAGSPAGGDAPAAVTGLLAPRALLSSTPTETRDL